MKKSVIAAMAAMVALFSFSASAFSPAANSAPRPGSAVVMPAAPAPFHGMPAGNKKPDKKRHCHHCSCSCNASHNGNNMNPGNMNSGRPGSAPGSIPGFGNSHNAPGRK